MSDQGWLHQTGEGLNPAAYTQTYGPHSVRDAEQATIVAVFTDAEAARACFRNLRAREVQVSLEAADAGEEEAVVEEQLRERAMGRGVVLGATVGATAGFLAGTYLVPPGAVTATGTMLTTLAGAGLGSFIGSLADRGAWAEGKTVTRSGAEGPWSAAGRGPAGGPGSAAPRAGSGGQQSTWRLAATVDRAQVDEVMDLITPWNPEELRVE